jgi:oxygen-independent coproporphyrinogen-3 oxidase
MPELPPLALYVHLPWCVRKCPYCDFNSHQAPAAVPDRAYVGALLRDLTHDVERFALQARSIRTIFLGGGTPSLFSAGAIADLLTGIRQRMDVAMDVEITLEANPGAADAAAFAGFRAAGVNRLSIGVQSLRDDMLERLGRVHDARAAYAAVDAARAAGFDNLNLDLMFALPQDSLAGSRADLDAAIALAPRHLSWYQLTIEPNTAFGRRPPVLPDGDLAWELQQQGQAMLAEAGYLQYEISAYAQPGAQARHNLNYWQFGDYLGIGAGAHGKLTASDGTIVRTVKRASPQSYLHHAGRPAAGDCSVVAASDLVLEFMLNGLRLAEGFTPALFSARTGLPASAMAPGLTEARRRGLLVADDTRVRATALGLRYLNDLLLLFVDEPRSAPFSAPGSTALQQA